jgi:hypothetical protein
MTVFVFLRRAARFVFGSGAPAAHRGSVVATSNAHAPAFWYLHGR